MTSATDTAARPASGSVFSLGNAALVAALAGLIALPQFSEGFFIFQMTTVLVYAVAIMGLNLLTGFNGQFSLGHGAFFAIGAYATAIMVEQAGGSYIAALPLAGLVCFAAGFLFGFPALKLEGVYLALATFALAVATPQMLKLSPLEEFTGGVQGITLFSETFFPPIPFEWDIDPDIWTYYYVLTVGTILYILLANLVKSRTGRAMMAIRDNPIAARSMGVNVALYKTLAFGISAMITGMAGSLAAVTTKFVAPDSFTFFVSVSLFVGMVIGGVGWLPGALVGGLFLTFMPNVAEEISKGLSGAFYGIFLILVIYLAPQGAGGLIRAFVDRIRRQFA